MTKAQLIQRLEHYADITEVMILDNGTPREINLGPTLRQITEQNAENAADCEEMVGFTVVVLGYGNY